MSHRAEPAPTAAVAARPAPCSRVESARERERQTDSTQRQSCARRSSVRHLAASATLRVPWRRLPPLQRSPGRRPARKPGLRVSREAGRGRAAAESGAGKLRLRLPASATPPLQWPRLPPLPAARTPASALTASRADRGSGSRAAQLQAAGLDEAQLAHKCARAGIRGCRTIRVNRLVWWEGCCSPRMSRATAAKQAHGPESGRGDAKDPSCILGPFTAARAAAGSRILIRSS